MNKEEVLQFLETDEGIEIVMQLKQPLVAKRDELLEKVTTLNTKFSDIEKAEEERTATAEAAKADAEAKRLKDTNDFDAYKAHHEDEISKRDSRYTNMQAKFAKTEMERLVAVTASKHSKSPMPLQLLLRDRVSSNFDDNGDLVITVSDENGQPMYYEGKPAGMEHLVDSLRSKDDYAMFFSASGSSGSGTSKIDGDATKGSYKDMNSDTFNLTKAMGNK